MTAAELWTAFVVLAAAGPVLAEEIGGRVAVIGTGRVGGARSLRDGAEGGLCLGPRAGAVRRHVGARVEGRSARSHARDVERRHVLWHAADPIVREPVLGDPLRAQVIEEWTAERDGLGRDVEE